MKESIIFDEKFDKMTPIEKYTTLCMKIEDENIVYLSKLILLSLFSLNNAVKTIFKVDYDYYVFSDESVKYLLYNTFPQNCFSTDIYNKAINILDVSKFIYRFTCAKKFNIKNPEIKQMRINSWGKSYIKTLISKEDLLEQYNQCNKKTVTYLLANHDDYKILLDYLYPYNERNSGKVNELNYKLDICFLS